MHGHPGDQAKSNRDTRHLRYWDKGPWKSFSSWRSGSSNFSEPQEDQPRNQNGNSSHFSHSNRAQNYSTGSKDLVHWRSKVHSSSDSPASASTGLFSQERKFRRSLTFFDGRKSLGAENNEPVGKGLDLKAGFSNVERKVSSASGESRSFYQKVTRWGSFNSSLPDSRKPPASSSSRAKSKKKEEAEATKLAETLTLSLMRGTVQNRILAVKEIRVVTKFSAPAREALGLSGAIGLLINLLNEVDWEQMEIVIFSLCNLGIGNRRFVSWFLSCLLTVLIAVPFIFPTFTMLFLVNSITNSFYFRNKILIVEGGLLARIPPILKSAPSSVREAVVAVVLSLASEDEHKGPIGQAGIIPFITRTLASGSVSGRCDAAHALFNLLGCESNRGEILATQPVPGLLSLLKEHPSSRGADKAAAVLYTFTAVDKGRLALVECSITVPALLTASEEGLERTRELAISTLYSVCRQSRKLCISANSHGARKVLEELEEEVELKLKKKIEKLVKCLDNVSSSSERSSSSSAASTPTASQVNTHFHNPEVNSKSTPVSPMLAFAKMRGIGRRPEPTESALKDLVEESMRGALSKIKSRVKM